MSNENEVVRLLVPIHIDALAVGKRLPDKRIFQWTNLAPDFSKLKEGQSYLFGSELDGNAGNPFAEADGLEPGIHLHFRLPRALKHGTQLGDSSVTFPSIPNRWLVQRFVGSDQPAYKAWLIQSDVETDDSHRITWPTFHKDKPAEFRTIGACTELTQPFAWLEEKADPGITAVGPGNPSFNAYYPACRGILGFYDSLEDVNNVPTPISYLVTGWHSDPQDDPLFIAEFRKKYSGHVTAKQRAQQFAEFQAWAKERAWIIKDDAPPRFNSPSRLLCHGVVRRIAWKGPDEKYMRMDDWDSSYKMAVGNTAGEAMAALLAPGEVDQDLLTALHGDTLSHPVTASDLQYELHERRFSGVRGDTLHLLRPEPDQPGTGIASDQTHPIGAVPVPIRIRGFLRDLNEAQQAFDRLSRRMEDCSWQVYAQWYLWTLERRDNGEGDHAALLKQQLDTAREALTTEREAWISARQTRDTCEQKLNTELGKHPKTHPDGTSRLDERGNPALKYRAVSSAARPFHRPNDPVIAISAPGEPLVTNNSWAQSRELKCRVSGQEVTGITLGIVGGEPVTITGEVLAETLFADWNALKVPDAIHRSLITEAFLLDEQNASTIARMASKSQQAELTRTIQALQNPAGKPPDAPNSLQGSLPDSTAAFNWLGDPWIPLFLVWEVSWQSDYDPPLAEGSLSEGLITERWHLQRSGNLVPIKAPPATTEYQNAYQGYSLLSPTDANDMVERLKQLNESHPLVNILKNLRVQTQALDGFNDALTLQQSGAQLPPFDFDAFLDTKEFKVDPVWSFINDGGVKPRQNIFHTAPRHDYKPFASVPSDNPPFLPIRCGRLRIEQLSIVDSFGQTLKLPVADINRSISEKTWEKQTLRRAHSLAFPPQEDFSLPPRFAQSTRLRFELTNASGSGDIDGPVCGWILPNHLDKSLMFYSATGEPQGALQKKLGLKSGSPDPGFYWRDVPGINIRNDTESLQRIKNTHLRNFCKWILGLNPDEGALFSGIVDDALASVDKRVPEDDPGVSILVGRPLALMQANLKFEAAGLPAHRLNLRPNFNAQVNVDKTVDTSGFERVKWPVRLGNVDGRNDGLIGIFQALAAPNAGAGTHGIFYPPWGQDKPNAPKFAAQNFVIDCDQPLHLTMLIDPQARIHATTGVLPRTFIELPPEHMTGAKRVRDVFFQTAPLLGPSDTPQMPRPSDDYGEWSWAFQPDVTLWKLDPNIVEATDRASFSSGWPTIAEGWLKLSISPVKVISFWVREDGEEFDLGTRVHLAWSLQGAESLRLEKIVKGNKTLPIDQWDAPPFPREYPVTVEAETSFRITAFAEDAPPSAKDLVIKIKEEKPTP